MDRACSSHVDDEERTQSEPSSSKRKKSFSLSSSNQKSAGIAVAGALQEQVKDPQSNLMRCSSSPAVVVWSTRENTPDWAESLLFSLN